MSALMYESETAVWREKKRFMTKSVDMDNHNGLCDIRKKTEY